MKITKRLLGVAFLIIIQAGIGCSSGGGSSSPTNPGTTKASLSLEFSNVTYQNISGMHTYYHTRTFTETNGVGVTLTSGQGCYQSTGTCDPSVAVNYRIEGSNNLIHTGKKSRTPSASDKFTLKYWGTDDNGNDVYIEQVMTVAGATHNP